MNMARSMEYSAVAPASLTRTVVRWTVLGAAGVIALFLALSHSMAASAAAPNCIVINYTTCVTPGSAFVTNTNVSVTYTPVAANTGYPPNTVVIPPYFDNIYGWVEVVTDSNGVLIDINPFTGQRIFPFTTGYGFPAFVTGNIVNVPFVNANFCNGLFGCVGFNGGVFNGNCNVTINCGTIPAGLTYAGNGVYTYKDNRFCGDGMLGFIFGHGSFCLNGQPLFANGTPAPVIVFRPFEVSQPTSAPATAPVTAAPVTAAPAATTTTTVTVPANTATALAAPQTPASGGTVHALSAPTTPAERAPRDDRTG
ncbi:MAG: hypothetical protein ACYDAR_15255 [Thermomicrobiales bacterium]